MSKKDCFYHADRPVDLICAGNVAVGSAMFSRVGVDDMGRFLRETLVREGVDMELLGWSRSR